jgi:predicted 3-demethylubiquinone-9 3-methyltransferase (glyoxalase superfamily)
MMAGVETLDPFLMFCGPHHGQAEDAIHHDLEAFPGGRIESIDRYGAGDGEPEGTVRVAVFELGGRTLRAIDSAAPHAFTFTPAISLWVECSSAGELEHAAARLVDGGQFLMPPGNYGFSAKFCWIADRYGVTWQLNLAAE